MASSETKFWSQVAVEPKRSFRFVLELSPFEAWTVKKVDRPSFEIAEIEHKFINHTFYYPGRVTWKEVTFTVVDPINPDNTGILMKSLIASGYRFPSSAAVTRSITKADVTAALGSPVIKVYAGGPEQVVDPNSDKAARANIIETWSFHNAWIKDTTMGTLDYETDELLNIDITLRYDWAQLDVKGSTDTSNEFLDTIDPKMFGPGGA
jgi:hypothetical protein